MEALVDADGGIRLTAYVRPMLAVIVVESCTQLSRRMRPELEVALFDDARVSA
jgi:hypothetical protein